MAAPATPAELQLAQRLRHLREDAGITQAQLAAAFNAEDPVRPATVSTWESLKTPSTPPEARLEPYARFFASPRSLEGEPHLLPGADLAGDEKRAYDELLAELRRLSVAIRGSRQDQAVPSTRRSWFFDDTGPATIICPDAPPEARGPLFSTTDPNFTRAHLYADLDALIELHGHIRAENGSEYPVFHVLASEADADDLSGHVVLVGGIAWNDIARHLLRLMTWLPVWQREVPELATGEIFGVGEGTDEQRFFPRFTDGELLEDVALLARVPNPYNRGRSLTICNGVHSRGVLGAVRALTDARLRDSNEEYLAERFPDGEFALLLRVPVVRGKAMSPDLRDPEAILYAWPSELAEEVAPESVKERA